MKFERHTGFRGSIPRNWIDKTFPRCPLCNVETPWEWHMDFGFNQRYHFRCPKCEAVFSVPVGMVGQRNVIDLAIKKASGNMVKIESVGSNKEPELLGKDLPLSTLQERASKIQVALSNPDNTTMKYCSNCGKPYDLGAQFCTSCGAKVN